MSVSRVFCKQGLGVLFDVLEAMKDHEQYASMRANIVISLGDLLSRFPNVVAPQCHGCMHVARQEYFCAKELVDGHIAFDLEWYVKAKWLHGKNCCLLRRW